MNQAKNTVTLPGNVVFHDGPPPQLGKALFEKEIPSDAALVTPLVVRTMEWLREQSLIRPEEEGKIGLCLEEALQNAVLHGNKQDFNKKVSLAVVVGEDEWGILITDQGSGFNPAMLPDPLRADSLWGESGRGLYLIAHYMDRAEFYNGGSAVLMAKRSALQRQAAP